MNSTGSFPVDIVLFAVIAAVLVFRLRSILGRRQGFERPPIAPETVPRGIPIPTRKGPVIDGLAEPVAGRAVPDPTSALGRTLAFMAARDRSFSTAGFLDGAETAFRMIVDAFAKGERSTLRPLLSDDTYAAFEGAIEARETANETQRTDIKAITTAAVEAADLRGDLASITVRFVSDQVNLTLDAAGKPVAGVDAVTEIVDLWTFERVLGTPDPTWRLVAARSA